MATEPWCYVHGGRQGSLGERCICGREPDEQDHELSALVKLAQATALIRRADALLRAWVEKYGNTNPTWLPPGGTVKWQEDASAFLGSAGNAGVQRNVTATEDRWLRDAAKRGAKVIAPGKLKDATDGVPAVSPAADPQRKEGGK